MIHVVNYFLIHRLLLPFLGELTLVFLYCYNHCSWVIAYGKGLLPAQKANIRMLQISVNGLEEGEFPALFQIQTSRFSLKLIYPVNLEDDQVIFCSKVQRMSLKQYRMRAGLGEDLTLCPWSSNHFATYISYKVLLLGNLTASSRKYCLSYPKNRKNDYSL